MYSIYLDPLMLLVAFSFATKMWTLYLRWTLLCVWIHGSPKRWRRDNRKSDRSVCRIETSFLFHLSSWLILAAAGQVTDKETVLWSYSEPRWDLSKMKSHNVKSTTDSYESSQYLLWLFSQLLLELHSVIFQPLDSNESVSTAEEKNRTHRLRDNSELGLNIGTGPEVHPDVTFDP